MKYPCNREACKKFARRPLGYCSRVCRGYCEDNPQKRIAEPPPRVPRTQRKRAKQLGALLAIERARLCPSWDHTELERDPQPRFVLVQVDPMTRQSWLSSHDTAKSAEDYLDADDSGFEAESLVDLDDGEELQPRRRVTFERPPHVRLA